MTVPKPLQNSDLVPKSGIYSADATVRKLRG